jgi:pyruvate dehydrogenase E2 component (dihydrolipoamide acetyltransferase)
MAFEFKLPDLAEGLTEGEIVKWLVKVGDPVAEGQAFVQVETDKAVIDIPAPRNGIVLRLGAGEGETVQVGQVIAVFEEPGKAKEGPPRGKAAPSRPRSVGVVGELEEAPEEEAEEKEKEPPRAAGLPGGELKILAVPMVRRLARDLGVDLRTVKGSGPGGRITKEDIRRAPERKIPEKEAAPAVPGAPRFEVYGEVERIRLRGVRKSIARSMALSKSKIPHALGIDEADITRLVALKEKARERAAQKKIHLTLLPFVIKVVVAALEEHPYLNSSFDGEQEEIILKKYYNIGIAVDTKDGLMVPVVKNVKGKNIFHLAEELADLSEKARSRTIDLADLKGGTFTITNYGAFGGTYGFPVIRYPEAAILGMGKFQEKPVVVDGQIKVRKMLPLSLSFDHRIADGAGAIRFLKRVIELLEDPGLILLEE